MTIPRWMARQRAGRSQGGEPAQESPAPSPLEFVLRVMRDETQAMALRASMAKAAMPYLHLRSAGDEPPAPEQPAEALPQWSDLEIARRIAHIFARTEKTLTNPVEKTEFERLRERVLGTNG